MNIKLEIVLLFLGGFIRLIVVGTSIWYLVNISYESVIAKYISIVSLIAPSAVMLVIFTVISIAEVVQGKFSCVKLLMAVGFIIGDSIGLNYFVFTVILCVSEAYSGDFYIVDAMFRGSSLINSLFQSMPQIVVQVYNNTITTAGWGIFNILSIGVSGLSLVYTIVKLAYAIDKIAHFESVSYGVSPTINTAKKITNNVDTEENEKNEIEMANKCDDNEVYGSGYD